MPPNPNPSGPTDTLPQDRVAVTLRAIQMRRIFLLVLSALHALVAAFYPSPPAFICPNSDNLSDALFTWSPYTAVTLLCIIVAAPIRLLAFKHLGANFTFRLAKPKALVKTGLYAHVQHPSYPTHWLVLVSNASLLLRLDGVLGCILPTWLVKSAMGDGVFGPWPVFLLLLDVVGFVGVWIRIKDEEAMLKREFGREWEEYNRKTKRFIPGVF
ncbi:hypothetical protein GQ53DRAFT_642975 [Thozetella sp. PMI_491]|nr:hypothetical protein GQ53DRAFT_642975 [Thozetella sp. PMI_491]